MVAGATERDPVRLSKAIALGIGIIAFVAALGLADIIDILRSNEARLQEMDVALSEVHVELQRIGRATHDSLSREEGDGADDSQSGQQE